MESLLHRLEALEKALEQSLKQVQAMKEEIKHMPSPNAELEAKLLLYHSLSKTNDRP
jgi:regulator of replication initiation timing